jgi:hypothetical protein
MIKMMVLEEWAERGLCEWEKRYEVRRAME